MIESIVDLLSDPGFLLTVSGEIVHANGVAEDLTGIATGQLRGRRIHDLVTDPPRRVDEFLRLCARSRAPVPWILHWRTSGDPAQHRCDGGRVTGADRAMLFLHCRPKEASIQQFALLNEKIDALSREIHERRRAQGELFRSEERYRTLVGATSSLVFRADADGGFSQSQEAWAEFTGKSCDEYKGLGWLEAIHAEDRENARTRWEQSVATGDVFEAQVRLWNEAEGEYRFCIIRAAPVRNADGNVREWMGTVVDVHERKKFEDQVRQAQRLESLGVLAGGVAHDFNNLLVGIMGNASLALESISSNHPAKAILRDLIGASETAANLTRQLLAYAGKGRFVIELIDLSELVREIGALLQTSISRNVQLRLELARGLPCIEGDASQLQQLVMNLVINAAEAIGEHQPGTVLVATGTQEVDENYIVTTLAPERIEAGPYVTLDVHDSGVGMTEETIGKIFDPFFTTKFTGRGLGLAAALGIVRGHRGAIKVYSTPGRGTTFKILFPASAQERPMKRAEERVAAHAGAETVLVVDDEATVRRTTKAMLERYGYTVILAENGKEGVDLFRVLSDKIGLVLLDMTMPVMSGEEAFRDLRAINADVPVLLSSGYNEVEAIQRFAGEGLAGFLQKPYSAAALAQKVRSVIDTARRQRSLGQTSAGTT